MMVGSLAVGGAASAADPDTVRREQVFSVEHAGRFAVRVESKTGASLQVIDRMAGPSALAGEPGKEDGRLDLLLDRGSYKAVMILPKGADQTLKLHVAAFRELNGSAQPRLVELKPVESDLDDLTERSWWIDVPSRRSVALEAAGRYLADLRLWKDGNWLVDAEPTEATVEPEPGHPLAVRRLVATIEPGLYLLTAYGGVGEAWAKESPAKPFYLRFGIPVIAEAERLRRVMSPFGVDRFLVPRPANHFRLQLDQPDVAALTVDRYNPDHPYASEGDHAEIAKNSRDPVAEIEAAPGTPLSLVTVERQPGQPYLLQNYYSAPYYGFNDRAGDYWIEVIYAATSDDDPDVTGVLTALSGKDERIVAASAIELAPGQAWRRRFNLLDTLSLHVAVAAPGKYLVTADGENVDAEFRFEPVGPRPEQYREPAFERGDHAWALEPGIYLLTVQPRDEHKGIATLTLKPADFTGDIVAAQRHSTVAWRHQPLADFTSYRLYTNDVPGISHGLVVRKLPLEIDRDLPMTLAPGEALDLPVAIPAKGALVAEGEDGKPVDLALDEHAANGRVVAMPGPHRLRLANRGDHSLPLSLRFERDDLRPETPLPALAADRLKQIPSFPTLTAEKPVFLDVARGEQRSFNIAVAGPALYRLESAGLLHTQGNLRTRIVTSLARADANGVGRNFLIQRYLREGDYQLSFAPQGASTGHLSLALTATPIEDRGALSLGIPSRATLRPGLALRYDFHIEHAGRYRLNGLGMNRRFALRVEDADGWPVAAPVVDGTIEQEFLPGLYHTTLLPGAIAARSLTLLEEVVPPPEYAGHGPHRIALGDHVSHEWLEPEAGGERTPDRWRFSVRGPADLSIDLGEGMIATLIRESGGQDTEVAHLIRNPGWSGGLAAGDYRLETTSLRPNNHLPYELSLNSEQLLVGQSRSVNAPVSIPIALGGNDLVEIGSFGSSDVRARLYDAAGRLIAANDDRADDWNFDMAATLPPGPYRLQVDPVGEGAAETRVDLLRPEEKIEPPLAIPGDAGIADAALHTFPLSLTKEAGLLVLAAQSPDAVSLSLEREGEGGLWRTVASRSGQSPMIAIPLASDDGTYRLRAWSTDRKTAAIKLVSRVVTERPASEGSLLGGLSLRRVEGLEPPVWASAVTPARPGAIRLDGDSQELRWTSARAVPAAVDPGHLVIAGSEPVWLVAQGDAKAPRLRGSRIDFQEETRLHLPPGDSAIAVETERAAGPVLWLAQSRFGQPGIASGDASAALVAMGVAAQSTVTVAMPGAAAPLRLWNAEDKTLPLELTLREIAFPAPASAPLQAGEHSLALAPRSGRLLALDGAGGKRLHLALPPHMVAVLQQGAATLATLWPDRESRSYTTELAADAILLLNAGDDEARATVVWNAIEGNGALSLAAGQTFKRYDAAADTLLLDAATLASRAAKLRIAGTGAIARVIADDGSVRQGGDIALAGHGRILVEHGPGLVAAWLEDDEGMPVGATALALDGAARIVRLSGPVMRFALSPTAPALLSLRTTAPVIASIAGPDGHVTTEVFADGGRLSRYVPAGRMVIALQSAADGDLAGDAEFIAQPVTAIDEGLGEAVRLAPGQSRLYSFTLPKDETIGVGLRASVDVAQCRLLDAQGKTLGSGIVQMHQLSAGTFLLAVEIPPDATPIEIRPALVGLHEPSTAPPDDVKRHYLQLVGRLPSE